MHDAIKSILELQPASDDPLDVAACRAAGEFVDACHAFGMGIPKNFPAVVRYYRLQLERQREFAESADPDLEPVYFREIGMPWFVAGWLAVLALVGAIVAANLWVKH